MSVYSQQVPLDLMTCSTRAVSRLSAVFPSSILSPVSSRRRWRGVAKKEGGGRAIEAGVALSARKRRGMCCSAPSAVPSHL